MLKLLGPKEATSLRYLLESGSLRTPRFEGQNGFVDHLCRGTVLPSQAGGGVGKWGDGERERKKKADIISLCVTVTRGP